MLRNSFLPVLIAGTLAFTSYAQTPQPKTDKDNAPRSFAWTLEDDGGYLGVQTQDVNKENFSKFGLPEVRGVAVEKVLENSPAAAAGIQKDDVIVSVNGDEITSVRKLTRLLGEIAPDHQVKVTVLRNGSEREISATLGKRPMQAFENGNFMYSPGPMGNFDLQKLKDLPQMKDIPPMKDMPIMPNGAPNVLTFPNGQGQSFVWAGGGRQIGIGVTPLTKQLAEHFAVEGGVMISDVREGSPAAKAGLTAGDIILEADGKAVKGEFDLIRAINEKKDGDVTLTFVRNGARQTVSVTPEASKDGNFFFRNDSGNGLEATPAPKLSRATPSAAPAPIPMTLTMPGRVL